MNIKKKILLAIFAMFSVLISLVIWYLNDSYLPMDVANVAFQPTKEVDVETIPEGYKFTPIDRSTQTGLIFYPGGKVETEAYGLFMQKLAEQGYDSFLVSMPFNLAVLNPSAAGDIIINNPEIEAWYIIGHSLGGAMAANFIKSNYDQIEGLILLGAYSATDLSNFDISILTLRGSEDKVLNQDKFVENRAYLPSESSIEIVIEGGNHAYFGHYGEQKSDGKATISREEQQLSTAEHINAFITDNRP
ncbi:alpha/beta hydrolase [Amphibacillus cookii]|uniref:alpha/beta hydrolase n=1 Tax=Amphibacillus cookii TaxID=767787 RepID=UPI00195BB95B|nr:alpha/beta hydrolase [Amphibacillus cookii]MBM7541752.1 dienelactone hydrolase [Amphibacillus cookii]